MTSNYLPSPLSVASKQFMPHAAPTPGTPWVASLPAHKQPTSSHMCLPDVCVWIIIVIMMVLLLEMVVFVTELQPHEDNIIHKIAQMGFDQVFNLFEYILIDVPRLIAPTS